MKRILLSLIFIFSVTISVFSQNEANNWFFGNGAGLDFSSGAPVSVTGGQIFTEEGCATISNSSGDLLFYTNGENVFMSDHNPMPNGTGLHGNQSSTQSAIIVPKPLSTTEYYIFTVDEHNTNAWGLQYSLVDMNANGGMGEVVLTEKNIPLLDHASEKITAVKSENCNSIWVIAFSSLDGTGTDGFNPSPPRVYDTFHSFEVTSTGVSASATSQFNEIATNDGRGYLKVSADGTKLAIAHTGGNRGVRLFDFNAGDGTVTNPTDITLSDFTHANNNANTVPYGLEFSLDTSKLYITSYDDNGTFNQSPSDGYLWQVDLNDATLPTTLISFDANNTYRGALQMGPDGKIYRAQSQHYDLGESFLGAINNPNDLGLACNYVHNAVPINFGLSRQGLPPFIQSLFITDLAIVIEGTTVLDMNLDLCDGETFTLEPDTSTFPVGTIYEWTKDTNLLVVSDSFLTVDNNTNFNSGHYRLTVDFNDGSCPLVGEAIVTFHDNPEIESPITIKQCDDDTDGVSIVDLTLYENLIIRNPMLNETLTYYPSLFDAQNQVVANEIVDFDNFITGNNTIYVSVENDNTCTTVGEINIQITTTSSIGNFQLFECDDFLDVDGNDTDNNDDADGISSFNFTSITNDVINSFSVAQQPFLNVSYFETANDALLDQNEITNITNYRNIANTFNHTLSIKITTTQNTDCIGLEELELTVERIPVVNDVTIRECAVDLASINFVNTQNLENDILQGQTNVTLTFFDENNVEVFPTLSNTFETATQVLRVVATNSTSQDVDGACSSEGLVMFFVDTQPFIAVDPLNPSNPLIFAPACDDGIEDTDLMANFDTSLVEYHLKGGNNVQTEMAYNYYNEDGSQIFNENGFASPLPDPFYTLSQTITVEMYNPVNNTCTDSIPIEFIVNPLPSFDINDDLLCLNYLPNPVTVNIENALETYQYFWYDKDNNDITVDNTQDFYNFINGGEYTVKAVNSFNCERTKIVIIEESEQPTIEDVQVYDNQESNRIAVIVSGISEYEFAIDDSNYELGNALDGHVYIDVTEGLRTIRVRDVLGCGEVSYEVPVIRFPKFFTPNGDGFNDTWQVEGSDAFPIINFTIFNRHGKVMAQFTDKEEGWNGTYLNKEAERTDYWYLAVIIDRNGKQIERRGHFSLR